MTNLHDLMANSESLRTYLVKHQNQTRLNDVLLKNVEVVQQVHDAEGVAAVKNERLDRQLF